MKERMGLLGFLLVFSVWPALAEQSSAAEVEPSVIVGDAVAVVGEPSAEDVVRQAVADKLPNAQAISVKPTPIDSIYQVVLNSGEIVHVHDSGMYLLSGDMFELPDNGRINNLTEAHRSAQRVDLIKGLSDQQMVSFESKEDAKAQIYVFTDTDCGYCRKFHDEVEALNEGGVTVHYLAWPRAGVESRTGETMVKIWCSSDPQGAMTLAKSGRAVPDDQNPECQHPIDAQLTLGAQLGVRGTPAVFTEDGRKIGGYLSAPDLLKSIGL